MEAYILDTVRTPRGKAKPGGGLSSLPALALLTRLFRALEDRQTLDTRDVEDVVIGCATQTGEQGGNLARTAALLAGWDDGVSGSTVNRFCASGIEAVAQAATKIDAGMHDLVVAGGVESVSRVPMFADHAPLYSDPAVVQRAGFVHMGIAADLVASLEGFQRHELDAYAVRSHHRAAHARDSGYFAPSLIPMCSDDGQLLLDHDEHIRAGTSIEQLAKLEPAFADLGAQGGDAMALRRYPQLREIRHVHHRGNSPSVADGAAALLIASAAKARSVGRRPRARIRAVATHSVEPIIMLTAAQYAVEKAVARAGLALNDIGLFEVGEAFAALMLKFQRDLRIDPERFNVNGGTLAMGHAFGASGAILTITLLDEMERRDVQFGVVAISGAAGLGMAAVLERI